MMTFSEIQSHSSALCGAALYRLSQAELSPISQAIPPSVPGVYRIVYQGQTYYVGEADNLASRIRQQAKERVSTFYKAFAKYRGKNLSVPNIPIDRFQVAWVPVSLGRNEVEESGMATWATPLNSMNARKARRVSIADLKDWDLVQGDIQRLLKEGAEMVISMPRMPWKLQSPHASGGVYVVWDTSGACMYVGESASIQERHKTHSQTTYFSVLRRHVGTELLGYTLKPAPNGKLREFKPAENAKVTGFLEPCPSLFIPISFGRLELQDYLIRVLNPKLNRRGGE
jgi:predicted GIY-YIG superfamily endonuclease